MNPIDEAIHEDLLERRIYDVESGEFFINMVHHAPKYIDSKFAEQWLVIQSERKYYGKKYLSFNRDSWCEVFEPHKELEHFYISYFFENVLQNEIQKKMTE